MGAGVALVASTLAAPAQPVSAFTRPPPGFRPFNDTIDGYKLFRPEDWIEVKGSGNDVFFRNPSSVEENMFVSISSPSSTKFVNPRDLGTPDEAAKKILAQYLNEFMSSRIGVRRESTIVSASERTGTDIDGEPMIFYDVELRISSYATKNQYGLTEADRPQSLEWDRVLSSTLGRGEPTFIRTSVSDQRRRGRGGLACTVRRDEGLVQAVRRGPVQPLVPAVLRLDGSSY